MDGQRRSIACLDYLFYLISAGLPISPLSPLGQTPLDFNCELALTSASSARGAAMPRCTDRGCTPLVGEASDICGRSKGESMPQVLHKGGFVLTENILIARVLTNVHDEGDDEETRRRGR